MSNANKSDSNSIYQNARGTTREMILSFCHQAVVSYKIHHIIGMCMFVCMSLSMYQNETSERGKTRAARDWKLIFATMEAIIHFNDVNKNP